MTTWAKPMPDGRSSSVLLDLRLRQRLGNQNPGVFVESQDGQPVVCGRVNTYYALQLTLAAVSNLLQEANGELPFEVSVAIHVGEGARVFHTVCRRRCNREVRRMDSAHGYTNANS